MSQVNSSQPPRLPAKTGPRRLSLADVTTKGHGLPSRTVLHGLEGVGKSSWAAHAPGCIFVQARGETGLQTLIDAGVVPETPHFPECQTWDEALGIIQELTTQEHTYKTLVIDTLNGLERLCHELVCARNFAGRWGKDGFTSYQVGYDVALADWRELLQGLDRLREQRRMGIIALCHTRVKNFKNPAGPDYDRYTPELHEKTWGLTHKWADLVLFANFETIVEKEGGRAKGHGGQTRCIYTVRHAAYDAKNRHNLPEEIDMGGSGGEAWANFIRSIKQGREAQKAGA